MTDSSRSEDRFSALADEFIKRQRLGQNPSIEGYAADHPDLADEIRLAFPALLMIDDLKPNSGDPTGNFDVASVIVRGAKLERLGDFRVLREAGRGGMGVVYEAEQESLGRRVALKVLAAHAISDPAQVKRFEREARAAAHLHHTNIVPVFGVGEQDGLHYYAMQFITGLGLDAVIEEVKRLRSSTTAPAPITSPDFQKRPAGAGPTAAGMIARSLLTEAFTAPLPVHDNPSTIDPALPAEPAGIAPSPRPSAASHNLSSGAALSASGISSGSGSDARYWRSVARVGLQVANALDYAHNQGILHRDIKPSNLLLDSQGTVWVADFGLAKSVEGEDLTHTGDIVGTIRYMAPERFHGRCDARSDTYALGLTLYEMVGLHPAFEQTGRQALIRQVMEEEPPRLRTLHPLIPRDLETVIQKAIARDPAGRYATAATLAEDLSLFLDDKPVRARDIGALERSWKWARRRPAIASLLGVLVVAVLAGLTAVTWQWRAAVGARDQARIARDEARANLKVAGQAVDTFFTTVSEDLLLNEPGMQPLRKKLLMLALPYYHDFAARGSNDPALRVALANAYLNWGTIDGDIGSRVGSKEILRTAISHFESLALADPTNFDVQIGLAKSYQTLARQSMNGDQGGEGFDEALRAAGVWTRVVKARPGDPEPRRMLGRSYDLAAILCHGRDRDESRSLFQKAVDILREAVQDFPAHAETSRQLAKAYSNTGVTYRMDGDSAGAEQALGKSLAIMRKLRDAQPNNMSLQIDLARTLLVRGQARLQVDASLLAAADDLEEGRLVIEPIVERNPDVSENRYILTDIYLCLGAIRAEQGHTASAKALLGKAIAAAREVLERDPSMSQIVPIRIESQSFLAAVERESGLADAARKTLGNSLSELSERFQTVRDADYSRAYFHALVELTMLDRGGGGEMALTTRPLLEGLREREAELRKRPQDNITRCQCVSGHLAIAQLLASSGATADALKSLETAGLLIKSGLELTPEHHRLLSQKARLETARGMALLRLDRIGEALAATDRAVSIARKLAEEDASYSYDLACALALKTRLDPAAPDPPSAAVAALRQAVEHGFDNVYKLNHDEHLDPIRRREDFQRLVPDAKKNARAISSEVLRTGK